MSGGVIEPGLFLIRQLAHPFRRPAHPQIAAFQFLVLRDQAAGAEEHAAAQHRAVENGGTHADETARFDGAAVDDALMADGDIVADHHGPAAGDAIVFVRAVKDAAVLDVGARADADNVHVTAHRAHRPDGGVRADDDVADDGRGFIDVNPGPDGGQDAFVRSYGH